jgi:hypothetical protein
MTLFYCLHEEPKPRAEAASRSRERSVAGRVAGNDVAIIKNCHREEHSDVAITHAGVIATAGASQ